MDFWKRGNLESVLGVVVRCVLPSGEIFAPALLCSLYDGKKDAESVKRMLFDRFASLPLDLDHCVQVITDGGEKRACCRIGRCGLQQDVRGILVRSTPA